MRERARWARAVLIAMDPDISLSQQADEDSDEGSLGGVAEEHDGAEEGAD